MNLCVQENLWVTLPELGVRILILAFSQSQAPPERRLNPGRS